MPPISKPPLTTDRPPHLGSRSLQRAAQTWSGRAKALGVVALLLGGLIVVLVLLANAGTREPVLGESDLIGVGLQVQDRMVIEGEHGEMIQLRGSHETAGGEVFAVIHTGDEKGWAVSRSEAFERAISLRESYGEPLGRVEKAENVWLVCEWHGTCLQLRDALQALPTG